MFTIQFYTSSKNSSFPDSGIKLLDGMTFFLHTLLGMTHRICLGMVSSIVDNEPAGWDYGCVLEQPHEVNQDSYRFHHLLY